MVRVIIFDFDGTLTEGDGPALRYAEEVLQAVSESQRSQLRRQIDEDFRLAGPRRWGGCLDGFDAVHRRAVQHHVEEGLLEKAYLRSRDALARGVVPVSIPQGLIPFLGQLPAYRVVITNSPMHGTREILRRTGVDAVVDELRADAGKPSGLTSAVRDFAEQIGIDEVLCVGDIWSNDLKPAYDLGGPTALISHGRPVNVPATFAGDGFAELYAPITAWARGEIWPSHEPSPKSGTRESVVRGESSADVE